MKRVALCAAALGSALAVGSAQPAHAALIPTTTVARAAISDYKGPNGQFKLTVSAQLFQKSPKKALAGKTVTFYSSTWNQLCYAVTDSKGFASCHSLFSAVQATVDLGFTAKFLGDDTFAASSDDGGLIVKAYGIPLP